MAICSKRGQALILFMCCCISMLTQVSMATVYKVGESAGWTIMGNPDYKSWAASKTFKIGDTIVFEYDRDYHNVVQVSHDEYRSCNVVVPRATYTTGKDTITIKKNGHYYFICAAPGHCEAGQKVDIRVVNGTQQNAKSLPISTPTPTPTPTPAPMPSLAPTLPNSVFITSYPMAMGGFLVLIITLALFY